MQSRALSGVVLALFFCSGATALVYEIVWSKFLALMFGSTVYAQTIVLAVFMGGLALGNWTFGRWADKWRYPVRAYGFLEMAIGCYAFAFPALERLTDRIFVAMGSAIVERAGLLLALKAALSALLLIAPTFLMGGTLPLLAAWLQKSSADAGRRSARFYSVNSLGAVTGAAIGGFWLVPAHGVEAALLEVAFLNVLVGGMAVLLGRIVPEDQPQLSELPPTEGDLPAGTIRRAGVIVAIAGGVSMGLEVLASRSLALIFGSSLQAFAIVLMAFILGIGLGSAWIASPRRAMVSSERMIVLLLSAAAAWVVLLVFNIERWMDLSRFARTGFARSAIGYFYNQLLTAGISLVILGVPAAFIGAVLPLMIRWLSSHQTRLGKQVGVLLTWNTLGAVAGTLLTGFLLMPQAGLRNAFGILALALGLLALWTAKLSRWSWGLGAALGVSVLAGLLFFAGDREWRQVMSSGMFRVHEAVFDPAAMARRKQHIKLLFYEDAPDATVAVEESDGVISPSQLILRINGKADATSGSDLSTQLLLAHVPMLSKPDARDVFVLGLGSGVTAGALLMYRVDRVDVGENCAPVIRAAKLFANWNRDVVSHPAVRIWQEDARTVLKLRPQLYDVIITEPSNPWTAGIGSVFSREFYELAASRLKPGGLMAQWFHLYETQDEMINLVLRTFSSVFPFVEIWDTAAGDILLVGSVEPWRCTPQSLRQGFALEGVRADLAALGIQSPEALLARQLASLRTGFAIPEPAGPIQTDLFPVLEYIAPVAFFIGGRSRLLNFYDERTHQQLLAPPEKLAALRDLSPETVRSIFASHSVNEELQGRLRNFPAAAKVPCVFATEGAPSQPAASPLDLAIAALNAGELDQAEAVCAQVLQKDPQLRQARYLSRIISRERQLKAR